MSEIENDARQAVEQSLSELQSQKYRLLKTPRVICFAEDEHARTATNLGAIAVGGDDLAERIQGGWIDFDAVVAHPAMMHVVGKLGKLLGPRNLMPNPHEGTVTPRVGSAVKNLTGGLVVMASRINVARNAASLMKSPEALVTPEKEVQSLARDALERKITILKAKGALCPRCEGPKTPSYYDRLDDPNADNLGRILACEDCQPSAGESDAK